MGGGDGVGGEGGAGGGEVVARAQAKAAAAALLANGTGRRRRFAGEGPRTGCRTGGSALCVAHAVCGSGMGSRLAPRAPPGLRAPLAGMAEGGVRTRATPMGRQLTVALPGRPLGPDRVARLSWSDERHHCVRRAVAAAGRGRACNLRRLGVQLRPGPAPQPEPGAVAAPCRTRGALGLASTDTPVTGILVTVTVVHRESTSNCDCGKGCQWPGVCRPGPSDGDSAEGAWRARQVLAWTRTDGRGGAEEITRIVTAALLRLSGRAGSRITKRLARHSS